MVLLCLFCSKTFPSEPASDSTDFPLAYAALIPLISALIVIIFSDDLRLNFLLSLVS